MGDKVACPGCSNNFHHRRETIEEYSACAYRTGVTIM